MADYTSLKVPALKELLKKRGLPMTGNKSDFVERLTKDDAKPATTEVTGEKKVVAEGEGSCYLPPSYFQYLC